MPTETIIRTTNLNVPELKTNLETVDLIKNIMTGIVLPDSAIPGSSFLLLSAVHIFRLLTATYPSFLIDYACIKFQDWVKIIPEEKWMPKIVPETSQSNRM